MKRLERLTNMSKAEITRNKLHDLVENLKQFTAEELGFTNEQYLNLIYHFDMLSGRLKNISNLDIRISKLFNLE